MKEKILDAAERRVRAAGFSEMSFRDLASDVGIKSASVHYHFPTKPDLGEALVERYTEKFKDSLDAISTDDLGAALDSFVALYANALVPGEAICLCAIMGAEAIGLPGRVNKRTDAFFSMNRAWLETLFLQHNRDKAADHSAMIVAALEGGMIVASASFDRHLFDQIARAAVRGVMANS
ncbi:MAG: TetR/AcrR family transcriptional regulator [Pseudomonadota bacterium]